MMDNYKIKSSLNRIYNQLAQERQPFLSHWQDISDLVSPTRSRFMINDVNKNERKNTKIYDSTALMASRTLKAGMMTGLTSPARPWFKLDLYDPDFETTKSRTVTDWLSNVTTGMNRVFYKSNLYNVLPNIYGDAADYATAAMIAESDPEMVIRFHAQPVGSYVIGSSTGKKIDIFFREFKMTARQIVEKFAPMDINGKRDTSMVSHQVLEQFNNGTQEMWFSVCHAILPNDNYNPRKKQSVFKKYASIYYESGSGNYGSYKYDSLGNDRVLRFSGFDLFPVMVARWDVTGEDFWGTNCPGMVSLGDNKQLQLGEERAAHGLEKMIDPALIGASSLRTSKVSLLPGDITYADETYSGEKLRPIHEVRLSMQDLEFKQQQLRQRISRAYYEDLFLMLANSDRRQITATEINERHEEKLLALSSVLEQLNQDLLDPLIDITFMYMEEQGLIPQPPPEIAERDLKVEYISIMAQAQKLVGIGAIERFAGFAGNLLAAYPTLRNKINENSLLDKYAEALSVPHGIIRTNDEVEEIIAEQQAAQAEQQQIEQMQQGAMVAKDLSQAKLTEDNALTELLRQANAGRIV